MNSRRAAVYRLADSRECDARVEQRIEVVSRQHQTVFRRHFCADKLAALLAIYSEYPLNIVRDGKPLFRRSIISDRQHLKLDRIGFRHPDSEPREHTIV
jgi:hypothetical protein